jgi:hypothetical protein
MGMQTVRSFQARNRLNKPNLFATGYHGLPPKSHGKEEVAARVRCQRGRQFLRLQLRPDRAGLSRILAVVGKTRSERASCAAALAFANFVQNGSSSKNAA